MKRTVLKMVLATPTVHIGLFLVIAIISKNHSGEKALPPLTDYCQVLMKMVSFNVQLNELILNST